jgi:hypothetical protein
VTSTRNWRRRVLVGLVFVVAFGLATVLAIQPRSAGRIDPDPDHVPINYIGDPVEIVLGDTGKLGIGVEPVYHQCDGHGHRVYASRHPIRFVVISDPTCPGGPDR